MMRKREKGKKISKIITMLFLFLLPLCGISLFHNHITNLVVVLGVLLILVNTLFFFGESRGKVKYLILYYILCFFYLVILYFRSKSFVSLVSNEFNIVSEGLTILKLVMPITLLYSLYYQDISKKEYWFIIKSWIIMIAGSIVLLNFFKISLSSYSDDFIKYSIFGWRKGIYYIDTASRGLFTYANQVAVVLLMLLLVTINWFLENRRNIFLISLICLAMIMLGTRVSSIGGLLSLIVVLGVYFILSFLKKEKVNKNMFLLLVPIFIWGVLLPISPFMNRNQELNVLQEKGENESSIDEKIEKSDEDSTNTDVLDEKIQYVYDNYNPNYLPEVFFLNYYPIYDDKDFWYEFVLNTKIEDMNYRLIEKSIVRRMIEINDKRLDALFGISNSRIQEVVNIESDFVLHFYAFGIIGSIILLMIYFRLLIKSGYLFVKNKTYMSFIMFFLVALFMFSSYLTGNILNSLFPTLVFVGIMGYLRKSIKKYMDNCVYIL